MTIDDWYEHARADAARRGLPGLQPLLESLADSARALRSVDWESLANREAAGTTPPGQAAPGPAAAPGGGGDKAEGARP